MNYGVRVRGEMRYQELKLRDAGRLVAIGLALATSLTFLIYARTNMEPIMGRRYWSTVAAIAFICPVTLVVAIWYLISTPAQDAKFLKWAEKNLHRKPGSKFDPALLNPTNPSYRTSAFSYWMAKRRSVTS